jgi:hypothetical protein
LLSSSAFFARILANEKAETLGPSESEVSVLLCSVGTGFDSGSLFAETCTVFTAGITATGIDSVGFVVSAIE